MNITAEFSVFPGDNEPRLRFISDTPGKYGVAVEDSVDHRVSAADIVFEKAGVPVSFSMSNRLASGRLHTASVFPAGHDKEKALATVSFVTPVMQADWIGKWIKRPGDEVPPDLPVWNDCTGVAEAFADFIKKHKDMPMDRHSVRYRGAFEIDRPVTRAVLQITGLGFYEFAINGHEVDGEHKLKPVVTLYQDHVRYQTLDVTDRLVDGTNVLGIECGTGWFCPPGKWWGWQMQFCGFPCAIAQLHIVYDNGSEALFATDESWMFSNGNVIESCMYDGEKAEPFEGWGWTRPDADTSMWQNVKIADAPTHDLLPACAPDNTIFSRHAGKVIWTHPETGAAVYDFGANRSGGVRIYSNSEKTTKYQIRHGEDAHDDGSLNPDSNWGAENLDIFTLAPRSSYAPRFTFHCFRYCEITPLDGSPLPDRVDAEFVTAEVELVGHFQSDIPLLNKIHAATVLTQRDCLVSGVPMDCAQRNERLGWLGDAHVTSEQAILNFDMRRFYEGWLYGIAMQQSGCGDIPHVSPRPCVCGDICWSAGYVFILWDCVKAYGDKELLRAHFPHVRRYADYLAGTWDNGLIKQSRYGDWHMCAQEEKRPEWKRGDPPVITEAFHYRMLKIIERMAMLLGCDGDAERYAGFASTVRDAANKAYFDHAHASYGGGHMAQSANAIALWSGIVPDEEKPRVLETLKAALKADSYHFTSGIYGTNATLQVLGEAGEYEIALKVVTVPDGNGYATMLRRMTTLTERWSAKDFSFSHIMFGSVDAWLHKFAGSGCVEGIGV